MMNGMDHLAVLRQKITGLRAEIAQIQESNNQYRREGRSEPQSQVAHGQRQERLQAIQQELAKVADLGRRVLTVEQRKTEHRVRIHPKASQHINIGPKTPPAQNTLSLSTHKFNHT
jgi:hypothetical protein